MRIIPKKTKVSTEFFSGISLTDILVGFFAILVMFFVFLSSLPYKSWIELALFFLFGLLLVRIDEEPNYMFLLQLLRHYSHERRFQKMDPKDVTATNKKKSKKELKQEKKNRKAAEKAEKAKEKASKTAPETTSEAESNPESTDSPAAEAPAETAPAEVDLDTVPLTRKEQRLAKKAQKRAAKQKKKAKKAEDKFLKSKKVSDAEKAPILERRKREAEERYYRAQVAEQKKNRKDIQKMTMITEIYGGFISYSGEYFGAAIEIPAVEFRFFSPHRRENSIDRALGSVIRSVGSKYAANLVKIERPMVLDDHIDAEYDKIDALKRSYERGVFSEEELKARVEIIYDRINELREKNLNDKVLTPHFYLVLFDSDKRQLDNLVQDAIDSLEQGEMTPHRLNDKELAVLLRYMNSVDFDEREIDDLDPIDYAQFALPESLEVKMRTTEVNSIITHNFRVMNYPLLVDDAWGASLFDMPGTKVVMKFSQMDRDKSIRAIDRSIGELNSQLDKTGVSSRVIELQTHIETLSELLVMLQNNNENLMAMNMYVTGYDIAATRDNKLLVPQPAPSSLPRISGMKKDIKRTFSEQGFKLTDMIAQQFEAFVATQINGYDPFAKKARGIPSSTVAGVFPWIYGNLNDEKGLNLGSSEGTPTFVDFFRRDHERVNSNMVIVGKSGGGKSYATKSLLSNLAADDTKIFVLDPENEYTELAGNLNGKFINVANSSHGRINPFQIITSLEDDEATDGQETSSYAAHLQFLEEFFHQILPEVDGDAMEYLNNLINRVYLNRNIDQFTNLSTLTAEDYPTFDDLYDCILEEFQRTKSDYLKSNLRVLVNHVSKFSTGGRNSNIWNGPSTLSTVENFIVFNFQTLLASRNNTIANAQMLMVLKYLDNEIIKNREYNLKYGANRKIVIVIDEAHVFIDAKYPLALDFMFQLAKRIRKYNGMQIVITQNIKDFVGSEELARKSTAIINACQYSFIFSLAPNDMHDLCTLYEKAGGINESEQEQIIAAPRGQAFVVTSPTSRSNIRIETPKPIEDMFTTPLYTTHYFGGETGAAAWEDLMEGSRELRAQWEAEEAAELAAELLAREDDIPLFQSSTVKLVEVGEEEILLMDDTPEEPNATAQAGMELLMMEGTEEPAPSPAPAAAGGPFSPQALQQFGFEALVNEIRRTVRQELENELGYNYRTQQPAPTVETKPAEPSFSYQPEPTAFHYQPEETPAPASVAPAQSSDTFLSGTNDWFTPPEKEVDWFTPTSQEDDWFTSSASKTSGTMDDLFKDLFEKHPDPTPQTDSWADSLFSSPEPAPSVPEPFFPEPKAKPEPEPVSPAPVAEPEELPLVYEVTLEQLMAMAG